MQKWLSSNFSLWRPQAVLLPVGKIANKCNISVYWPWDFLGLVKAETFMNSTVVSLC